MSFWANKLNQNTAPAAPQPIATSRDLYGLYVPVHTPSPVPEQESIPQTVAEYKPSVRLTQSGRCPGCGSDRYIAKINNRVVSCSECGYNPAFEQSGYGEGSLQGKGAKPARQSADRQTMDGSLAQLKAGGGYHMHDK